MHRREFLKASSAALVAAGLAPFLLGSAPESIAGNGFDQAKFETLLHTWFRLRSGGTMELVAVGNGIPSSRTEQFTLLFRDPASTPRAEGTYEMTTAEGEALSLFLEPTGTDAPGATHRAAFSLLRPLSVASCAGGA